jgi:hypothetical protein
MTQKQINEYKALVQKWIGEGRIRVKAAGSTEPPIGKKKAHEAISKSVAKGSGIQSPNPQTRVGLDAPNQPVLNGAV